MAKASSRVLEAVPGRAPFASSGNRSSGKKNLRWLQKPFPATKAPFTDSANRSSGKKPPSLVPEAVPVAKAPSLVPEAVPVAKVPSLVLEAAPVAKSPFAGSKSRSGNKSPFLKVGRFSRYRSHSEFLTVTCSSGLENLHSHKPRHPRALCLNGQGKSSDKRTDSLYPDELEARHTPRSKPQTRNVSRFLPWTISKDSEITMVMDSGWRLLPSVL